MYPTFSPFIQAGDHLTDQPVIHRTTPPFSPSPTNRMEEYPNFLPNMREFDVEVDEINLPLEPAATNTMPAQEIVMQEEQASAEQQLAEDGDGTIEENYTIGRLLNTSVVDLVFMLRLNRGQVETQRKMLMKYDQILATAQVRCEKLVQESLVQCEYTAQIEEDFWKLYGTNIGQAQEIQQAASDLRRLQSAYENERIQWQEATQGEHLQKIQYMQRAEELAQQLTRMSLNSLQ
jgi:hypothetical protein